ncbi:MAG: hypothetical protein ABI977_34390 [Acidobacteriota bacterium]
MTIQSISAVADNVQSESLIEQLMVEQAEPLIRDIVGYRLRSAFDASGRTAAASESEDVCSEVRLQLLSRLTEPGGVAEIRDFRSYVAVTAYRACYEYLRRKYPRRYSLKHKLRFLLGHKSDFALWQTGRDEWLCGLADGQGNCLADASRAPERLTQLRDDPQRFTQQFPAGIESLPLEQLLTALLGWLGGPIELDQLVSAVAELLSVKDQPARAGSQRQDAATEMARLADPNANVARAFDQRRYLEALWQEIRQLSPRHCAALLLNLKDERGGSATDLFLFTSVATFQQMAAALAISDEELARIWNRMPLDDLAIAARLELTRQQVINLRQSARVRLSRRMSQLGY